MKPLVRPESPFTTRPESTYKSGKVVQTTGATSQNLSIKHFFGNSINAVKSQIWIAVCVYLIVIIAKKRLNLPASPQLLLNIFEVNMFEKIPLDQLVTDTILNFDDYPLSNQLFLL